MPLSYPLERFFTNVIIILKSNINLAQESNKSGKANKIEMTRFLMEVISGNFY